MLRVSRGDGKPEDRQFRDFPDLLEPSGSRAQAVSPQNPASREFLKGRVEVLLTRQLSQEPNEWECLVRPGRKIGVGEKLFFGDGLEAEVIDRGSFGERRIRFEPVG